MNKFIVRCNQCDYITSPVNINTALTYKSRHKIYNGHDNITIMTNKVYV